LATRWYLPDFNIVNHGDNASESVSARHCAGAVNPGACILCAPGTYQPTAGQPQIWGMLMLTRDFSGVPKAQFLCSSVAERLMWAYPALPERVGVGSILANSDAQNVASFRLWRFEMNLSPFLKTYSINTRSGVFPLFVMADAVLLNLLYQHLQSTFINVNDYPHLLRERVGGSLIH
jgi:hypothetical protein